MPDSPQDRAAGGRDSWTRRRRSTELVPLADARAEPGLPPVLAGRATPAVERQVGSFYASVAEVFERWVARRDSKHTRRAYRQDVMAFVESLGIRWPDDAMRLFTVSVADVQDFRDRDDRRRQGAQDDQPPHRLALELLQVPPGGRLGVPAARSPCPNPAHAQFIPRGSSDPRDETKALSATRARQLMGLPAGDTVLDYRDRAIIEVLPLQRGPDRHRLPAQGQGLPPGRRRGDDHAAREGRQASPHRPPLRRGPGDLASTSRRRG